MAKNYHGVQINQSPTIVEKAGVEIADCRNRIMKYDENGNPSGKDLEVTPVFVGILEKSDQNWEATNSCFMDITEMKALIKKYNKLNGITKTESSNYEDVRVKCVDIDAVAAVQEQIEAMKQTVSMLIIDKKRMKMKDAGLPQAVMASASKLMQRAKLPIVKAKVGPQVLSLVCDEKIFDSIPVKKEVKATVSGIYITSVKGLHGKSAPQPAKKKSWWKRAADTIQEKGGAKSVK